MIDEITGDEMSSPFKVRNKINELVGVANLLRSVHGIDVGAIWHKDPSMPEGDPIPEDPRCRIIAEKRHHLVWEFFGEILPDKSMRRRDYRDRIAEAALDFSRAHADIPEDEAEGVKECPKCGYLFDEDAPCPCKLARTRLDTLRYVWFTCDPIRGKSCRLDKEQHDLLLRCAEAVVEWQNAPTVESVRDANTVLDDLARELQEEV